MFCIYTQISVFTSVAPDVGRKQIAHIPQIL